MALADPPFDAGNLRRFHHDFALAVLAAATLGAAVALQVVSLATGRSPVESGVVSMLWVFAALFTMAWLVSSLERRLVRRLNRIEGSRYRDGYAAGYLDAAARARDGQQYERPQLRPVR